MLIVHVLRCTAYQISSREGSNSTTHERRPPEDGQTIVTETCRGFNGVFYKYF